MALRPAGHGVHNSGPVVGIASDPGGDESLPAMPDEVFRSCRSGWVEPVAQGMGSWDRVCARWAMSAQIRDARRKGQPSASRADQAEWLRIAEHPAGCNEPLKASGLAASGELQLIARPAQAGRSLA